MWGKIRRKKIELQSSINWRVRLLEAGTGTQNFTDVVAGGARSLSLADRVPILIKLLEKWTVLLHGNLNEAALWCWDWGTIFGQRAVLRPAATGLKISPSSGAVVLCQSVFMKCYDTPMWRTWKSLTLRICAVTLHRLLEIKPFPVIVLAGFHSLLQMLPTFLNVAVTFSCTLSLY